MGALSTDEKPGRIVSASSTSGPFRGLVAGGGVWTPVAAVGTRLAPQREQLIAETEISLPQRLQTMDREVVCVRNSWMIARHEGVEAEAVLAYAPTVVNDLRRRRR